MGSPYFVEHGLNFPPLCCPGNDQPCNQTVVDSTLVRLLKSYNNIHFSHFPRFPNYLNVKYLFFSSEIGWLLPEDPRTRWGQCSSLCRSGPGICCFRGKTLSLIVYISYQMKTNGDVTKLNSIGQMFKEWSSSCFPPIIHRRIDIHTYKIKLKQTCQCAEDIYTLAPSFFQQKIV